MKHLLVDTNVFMRWLLRDNEEQFAMVESLMKGSAYGTLSLSAPEVVLFELNRVLQSIYKLEKVERLKLLRAVLTLPVTFDNADLLSDALYLYSIKAIDFEDCFLVIRALDRAEELVTFDSKLQNVFEGLRPV